MGRYFNVLKDAQENRLKKDTQVIDLFQLPDWKDTILPNKFKSKFDLYLDKFRDYILPPPRSIKTLYQRKLMKRQILPI